MISNQLHYSINTHLDYETLFGEKFSFKEDGFLSGFKSRDFSPLSQGEIAYYYAIVARDNSIRSEDVNIPHNVVRVKWLDQVFVPHDLIFTSFAIARHIRTGENLDELKKMLREQMKQDVDEACSHYVARRKTQDWQNFYLRDVQAIYFRDDSIATKGDRKRSGGRDRIAMLRDNYDTEKLERILIPGPNGTSIYVLAKEGHVDLFDRQVRATVEERIPYVERVTRSRARVSNLLERIRIVNKSQRTLDGKIEKKEVISTRRLQRRELDRLERLMHWANIGEPLIIGPDYDPRMDGCSDILEEDLSENQYVGTVEDGVAPF